MYSIYLFLIFAKQHFWLIFGYMFCTCLSYPLESILLPKLYSSFFEQINKTPTQEVFLYYFGLIFLLIIIVNISGVIDGLIESYLLPKWKGYYMDWIFKYMLQMYENKLTDVELGKLVVNMTILPRLSKDLIMDFVTWTLPRIISVVIIHIYFFWVDFRLGFISLSILLIYIFISFQSFIQCSPLVEKEHVQFESKMQTTQDRLSNTFSIYSTGNMEKEIANYEKDTEIYVYKDSNKMNCYCWANTYTSFFIVATMMSINGYTTFLFLNKKIKFQVLMSIYMIVMYYIPSLENINREIPNILTKYAILKTKDPFIADLYQTYLKDQEIHPESSLEKNDKLLSSGDIEIKNLTFSYRPDSKKLFENFSLHIADKTKVAIVGPSGSGKSSLIKLIMGYYPVPDGTIFIDGQDINQYSLNGLRKQISYVNQNTKLFDITLLENICYGNEEKCSREKIVAIMKQTGIEDVFRNVHLDDRVGVDGNNLSGGQRQIVYMIRCILRQNPIVVLDEPTSALDADLKAAVIRVIYTMSKQSTLIIITHDESLLFLVDRVLRMK